MTGKLGKLKLLCTLMCLLIVLCSCFGHDKLAPSQSSGAKPPVPENIILNVDASTLSAPAVSKLQVETFKIDIEDAKDLFMTNKSIINETINESIHVIEAADGSSIANYVGVGSFFAYSTPFSDYLNNIFACSKSSPRYKQSLKYLTGDDLPFCTINDAIGQMKSVLHSFGIDNVSDVTAYSLDYKSLSDDEQAFRDDPDYKIDREEGRCNFKGTWTEADDCYVLVAELALHDIPIIPDDFESIRDETILPGNKIECMINKDGIQQLMIYSVFTEKSADDASTVITCSQALQKVVDKYSAIITSDTYEINDVRLMYVSQVTNKEQTEYVLVPAWCFTVIVTHSEADKGKADSFYSYEQLVMINAFNGEEIY